MRSYNSVVVITLWRKYGGEKNEIEAREACPVSPCPVLGVACLSSAVVRFWSRFHRASVGRGLPCQRGRRRNEAACGVRWFSLRGQASRGEISFRARTRGWRLSVRGAARAGGG